MATKPHTQRLMESSFSAQMAAGNFVLIVWPPIKSLTFSHSTLVQHSRHVYRPKATTTTTRAATDGSIPWWWYNIRHFSYKHVIYMFHLHFGVTDGNSLCPPMFLCPNLWKTYEKQIIGVVAFASLLELVHRHTHQIVWWFMPKRGPECGQNWVGRIYFRVFLKPKTIWGCFVNALNFQVSKILAWNNNNNNSMLAIAFLVLRKHKFS